MSKNKNIKNRLDKRPIILDKVNRNIDLYECDFKDEDGNNLFDKLDREKEKLEYFKQQFLNDK